MVALMSLWVPWPFTYRPWRGGKKKEEEDEHIKKKAYRARLEQEEMFLCSAPHMSSSVRGVCQCIPGPHLRGSIFLPGI